MCSAFLSPDSCLGGCFVKGKCTSCSSLLSLVQGHLPCRPRHARSSCHEASKVLQPERRSVLQQPTLVVLKEPKCTYNQPVQALLWRFVKEFKIQARTPHPSNRACTVEAPFARDTEQTTQQGNQSEPHRTRLGSLLSRKNVTAAATPSRPKMARTAMLCRMLRLHCASRNCSSSGSGNEKAGCAAARLRAAAAARLRTGCGSPSSGGLASSMQAGVQAGTQQMSPEVAPEQLMQGTPQALLAGPT